MSEKDLKLEKTLFTSLQKVFSILTYSDFKTLKSRISSCHEMPKYETNMFY